MSIFATIAIVCTMATCNNYGVDSDDTEKGGIDNTNAIALELQESLADEIKLKNWLKKYRINETIFEIVSIDLETHQISDEDIP